MATLENILKNIEKIYQQKYGVAVFNIEIKSTKNGVKISGSVLTENQRDYMMNALKKNKIKIKKESLKILSDVNAGNEIGWAVVKNKITDLKLRFVSNEIISDKILKRIRCSQAFQGEILRVLFKKDDQLLVQQNDLSLGWVDRKNVILKRNFSGSKTPQPPLSGGLTSSPPDKGGLGGGRKRQKSELDMYRKWKRNNVALKGKMINLPRHPVSYRTLGVYRAGSLRNKIIGEARKFFNIKYVLGGKSKKGIDCSGLTQVAYKNSLDIILPRHSRDQKEVGKKVNLKNVKSGDLVFLIKKSNQHKHVGIVELNNSCWLHSPVRAVEPKCNSAKRLHRAIATMEPASIYLIHASLEKKKVIRQSLEEVFGKYDFVEVRRIVE